jgi:hypothetical protein
LTFRQSLNRERRYCQIRIQLAVVLTLIELRPVALINRTLEPSRFQMMRIQGSVECLKCVMSQNDSSRLESISGPLAFGRARTIAIIVLDVSNVSAVAGALNCLNNFAIRNMTTASIRQECDDSVLHLSRIISAIWKGHMTIMMQCVET